jgi:hypothetical protein
LTGANSLGGRSDGAEGEILHGESDRPWVGRFAGGVVCIELDAVGARDGVVGNGDGSGYGNHRSTADRDGAYRAERACPAGQGGCIAGEIDFAAVRKLGREGEICHGRGTGDGGKCLGSGDDVVADGEGNWQGTGKRSRGAQDADLVSPRGEVGSVDGENCGGCGRGRKGRTRKKSY